jgi:hypothetical protein
MHTTDRAERLRNDILGFIEAHSGAIKSELDDYITRVKESGSKKTIQKELRFLVEEEKSIYVERIPANSARHRLYINSDSEVYKFMKLFGSMKDSLFALIHELKKKHESSVLDGEDPILRHQLTGRDNRHLSDKLLLAVNLAWARQSLYAFIEHLIGMYMLYFLFEWPNNIAEEKNLNRLYSLAFETIKDIRNEISLSFPTDEHFGTTPSTTAFVDRMFILNSYRLCATLINFDTIGVKEPAEAVVDELWKFSSPFVPSNDRPFYSILEGDGKEKRLVKNWRKVVEKFEKAIEDGEFNKLGGKHKELGGREGFRIKYLVEDVPLLFR